MLSGRPTTISSMRCSVQTVAMIAASRAGSARLMVLSGLMPRVWLSATASPIRLSPRSMPSSLVNVATRGPASRLRARRDDHEADSRRLVGKPVDKLRPYRDINHSVPGQYLTRIGNRLAPYATYEGRLVWLREYLRGRRNLVCDGFAARTTWRVPRQDAVVHQPLVWLQQCAESRLGDIDDQRL